MPDQVPNQVPDQQISVAWPGDSDVPILPANIFTLAHNQGADEFDLTLGRVDLPPGDRPPQSGDTLPVRVVARLVLSRPFLRELGEAMRRAVGTEGTA